MKVLLINPNWRKLKKVGRFDKNSPVIPLELLYISDVLDQNNVSNSIEDLWASNKNLKSIKEEIESAEYIVLTTAPSYVFWRDGTVDARFPIKQINKINKINKNSKIIVIGPQGTTTPSLFPQADYIIKGEPEFAVKDIIENKITKGICCKGKINNSYAIIEDLNKLPDINYKKLNLSLYKWPTPPKQGISVAIYESSRGCPYKCLFCFREGFRGRYREKSIEKIKGELELLKKLNVQYISIIDENFGVNKALFKKICMELEKNNLKWTCETRSELLDEDTIDLMADSGCMSVELGLESGDKTILRNLGKGTIDLNKLRQNIKLLSNKGIKTHIFLIVGSPGETKQTLKNTLDYISAFPLNKINCTAGLMIPYPNTPLWQMGLKEGKDLRPWENVEEGTIGNNFSKSEIQKEFLLFSLKLRNLIKHNSLISSFILLVSLVPTFLFKGGVILKIARKAYYLFLK